MNKIGIRRWSSAWLLQILLISMACADGKSTVHDGSRPASFQLISTRNKYNFVLLDSRNGQLWQIQYSPTNASQRLKLSINAKEYASGPDARPGRFAVVSTADPFDFLLLDTDMGNVWQFHYDLSNNNYCEPIMAEDDKMFLEFFSVLSTNEVFELFVDKGTAEARKKELMDKANRLNRAKTEDQ